MLALAAAPVVLSGCAGGVGGGSLASPYVGYQAANAISKLGYRMSEVAPGRYRIEVGGRDTTPRQHLEKIATVRAAEFGVEEHLRYFKLENVTLATYCTAGKSDVHKSGGYGELRHSLLTAEVSYAKSPPDATYLDAKEAFGRLRPELDTDVVTPEQPTAPASCS